MLTVHNGTIQWELITLHFKYFIKPIYNSLSKVNCKSEDYKKWKQNVIKFHASGEKALDQI